MRADPGGIVHTGRTARRRDRAVTNRRQRLHRRNLLRGLGDRLHRTAQELGDERHNHRRGRRADERPRTPNPGCRERRRGRRDTGDDQRLQRDTAAGSLVRPVGVGVLRLHNISLASPSERASLRPSLRTALTLRPNGDGSDRAGPGSCNSRSGPGHPTRPCTGARLAPRRARWFPRRARGRLRPPPASIVVSDHERRETCASTTSRCPAPAARPGAQLDRRASGLCERGVGRNRRREDVCAQHRQERVVNRHLVAHVGAHTPRAS
jgi:hypothetical protein